MYCKTPLLLVAGLMLPLAACAGPTAPASIDASQATQVADAATDPDAGQPTMHVHKTATCGCCSVWIEHVRDAGFRVEAVDVEDLGPVKARLGVPYAKGSCHTAEIGGYLVEGHVPVEDIRRLLAERPDARGLVLPGMPLGSPGMEMPDGRRQAFTVELVERDGTTRPFSRHPARAGSHGAL